MEGLQVSGRDEWGAGRRGHSDEAAEARHRGLAVGEGICGEMGSAQLGKGERGHVELEVSCGKLTMDSRCAAGDRPGRNGDAFSRPIDWS